MRTGTRTALSVGLMVATAAVVAAVLVRRDLGESASEPTTSSAPDSSVTSTTTTPPMIYASGWNRLPDAPLDPRTFAVTAVVGDEVYVFGGSEYVCRPGDNCPLVGRVFRDGAAYHVVRGTWRAMADAPIDVANASTAVIGDDIYLLSGFPEFGVEMRLLRYSTVADTWTEIGDLPDNLGLAMLAHRDRLVVFPVDGMIAGSDQWMLEPTSGTWSQLPDHGLPDDVSRWLYDTPSGLLLVATDEQHAATILRLADDESGWVTLTTGAVRGVRSSVVGDTLLFSPYAYDGSAGGVFDAGTLAWSALPTLPEGSGSTTTAIGLITGAGTHITGRDGPVWDARAGVWLPMALVDGRDWPAIAGGRHGLLVFGGQDWSTVVDTGGNDTESPLLADAWLWVPPPPT
ncbi:MAG: hypothetical protein Q8M22_14440 [Actinomycetota bacterium]|nr:hypothetical protein [Actinomycetota bacterium]